MKKNMLVLIVISLFTLLNVNAASSNSSVSSNLTEYSCSSFQDPSITTNKDAYFGRCMQARCNGRNWELSYYSSNTVTCTNGNLNPYIKVTKSGCNDYSNNKTCSGQAFLYCTTLTYFDCSRTSNGSTFTTTTKKPTQRPTTKKPTTTPPTTEEPTTTPALNNNTYLSNITLSNGAIQFNKETKEYNIEVESTITSINVTATPEASTSSVNVTGNESLTAGNNVITITVTAEDGSTTNYIINVNKKETISNNANLASITIEGYDLNFDPNIYNYTLKIGKEESLTIEAVTQDESAYYMIEGNSSLKNKSIIKINTTAPDGQTTLTYAITIRKSGSSGLIITILFIIILIVVLGAVAFYFFTKKKNSGEKEYEYE